VAFLAKSLAKAPEERFGSAEEMAAALRAAARPAVPMEMDVMPWAIHEELLDDPLVPRFARAARTGLALSALAATVVAGAWLSMRTRIPPRPGATVASQPASPFVPAAIESPPPARSEVVEIPGPPAPPASVATEPVARPAPARPVRAAHLEPRRLGPLPEERPVMPAVLETSHLVEEAVAPEVAEAAVADDSPGRLQIGVRPWAVVRIDDRRVGETPLAPLELAPGTYTARFEHPDYQPFVRRVTVRPAETVRLQVDLGLDGIAR
jgi:hypothetical protein